MNIKQEMESAKRAEADAKKRRRAAEKFEKEVEMNKNYFLEKWGVSAKTNIDSLSTGIRGIASKYGCSTEELLRYMASPDAIEHYRQHRGNHKASDE